MRNSQRKSRSVKKTATVDAGREKAQMAQKFLTEDGEGLFQDGFPSGEVINQALRMTTNELIPLRGFGGFKPHHAGFIVTNPAHSDASACWGVFGFPELNAENAESNGHFRKTNYPMLVRYKSPEVCPCPERCRSS